MAFQSWTCALSGEPIPSGFLDADHGHVTVLFPNGQGLRGLYTGFGVVLEAQALASDDSGRLTPVEAVPEPWLNEQGEVSIYNAWAAATCQMDYHQLLNNGFDPESMALEKAVVVKTREIGEGGVSAHYADLTPGGPCPFNGIFYGTAERYQQSLHPVQPNRVTPDVDLQDDDTPTTSQGMT